LAASVPLIEIPFEVTVFVFPTVFDENVAAPVTLKRSPETRLSVYDTDAVSVPSYVLLFAVMVTFNVRTVMSAVVVGDPVNDNV
jgi:hypothetical protein